MLGMLIGGSAEGYMLYVVNAKTPPSDAPLTLRDIATQVDREPKAGHSDESNMHSSFDSALSAAVRGR